MVELNAQNPRRYHDGLDRKVWPEAAGHRVTFIMRMK